jgi:hypothetical protein
METEVAAIEPIAEKKEKDFKNFVEFAKKTIDTLKTENTDFITQNNFKDKATYEKMEQEVQKCLIDEANDECTDEQRKKYELLELENGQRGWQARKLQ